MDETISLSPHRNEWRCVECGKLLGVQFGNRMEIRHKDAFYIVSGTICGVCRGCRTANHASSATAALRQAG